MSRKSLLCSIAIAVGYWLPCHAQTQTINIVSQFISPGASIAQLFAADPLTGRTTETKPAVIQIMLDGSRDIAFAESTKINAGKNQVLTISVLQPEDNGYRPVFIRTYYDKVLFAQDFKTIGFQEIKLDDGKAGLLVITSSGASLGGDIEIFTWKEGEGLVNVVPAKVGGGHSFTWIDDRGKLRLSIAYGRSKYDTNVPPPVSLAWNQEKETMEILK